MGCNLKSVDSSSIGEESSSSTALASDADDPNGRSEPTAHPVRGLMDTLESLTRNRRERGTTGVKTKRSSLPKL